MAGKTILVEIVGDAGKFKAAAADAAKSAKGFGTNLGDALKVAGAATLAVGAVAAVGAVVFSTGAKMEAMDAKANTVFGDSLPMIKKWAKENAAAMGLTAREATGLAANMGDLLVPMGFTRQAAADMSSQMVGLSGALSEWSGGERSAAEVSATLQKALLGERDELKGLGISITEADVKAQLLKDGTDKLTGSALEQAKAQATMTLILAKSTDAQTAYHDGTAKGLRTQHEMEATLNEVKETLITALYPVLVKVAGFLKDNLPGAIKTVGAVFGWLSKNVFPTVGVAIGIIVNAIKILITVWGTLWGVASTVVGRIASVFRGLVDTVKAVINAVIRGINSVHWQGIPNPLGGYFAGFAGFKIPYLHAGGVVPGLPGSNVPAMLQAGERVIPAGGSAQTIIVNIESFIGSDQDIDRFTDRIALRLRLAGVT